MIRLVSADLGPQYPGPSVQISPPHHVPPLPFPELAPFAPHLPRPVFANHMPMHYASAFPLAAAQCGFRQRSISMDLPQRIPVVLGPIPNSAPVRTHPLPEVPRPLTDYKEYQGIRPDGSWGVLGLEDQYGNKIPHSKSFCLFGAALIRIEEGQHYRWVDKQHRASGTAGFVDYCNLRIKVSSSRWQIGL
jgi:hypothetical protein